MQRTQIITDNTMRELSDHGTREFPFEYNEEDIGQYGSGRIKWHWHHEFELIRVQEGALDYLIGNQRIHLEKGQGLFCNTAVMHSIETKDKGLYSDILFSSEMIGSQDSLIYKKYMKPFIESDISHMLLQETVPWQNALFGMLQEVFDKSSFTEERDELAIHIMVCNIWHLLYEHKEEMTTLGKAGSSSRSQARLRLMMQFIEENYAENILLADIADSANISRSEATRCFQSCMQSSPVESLNRYRVYQAKKLILNTEDSITEIAMNVGFENCGYFDRVFRQYTGMTPRKFRNSERGKNGKSI